MELKAYNNMEKKINNTEYASPAMEIVEFVLEGSILNSSGGTAGGDAGGEDGWDE